MSDSPGQFVAAPSRASGETAARSVPSAKPFLYVAAPFWASEESAARSVPSAKPFLYLETRGRILLERTTFDKS